MPEGDSVYRAASKLHRGLAGQTITKSDLRIPSLATKDLSGAVVTEVVPRGKHLMMRFDSGVTLHSHLKMEGRWDVQRSGSRWRKPAHTARAILRTATTDAIGYQVLLDLVRTEQEDRLVGHLGPDLLGPDWDAGLAVANLSKDPDVTIGDALLQQRNLAGVGNVFKCEVCFVGGIDPATPVGAVTDLEALVQIAYQQLQANKNRSMRVTTGSDRAGERYWVYGRRGPCVRCGTMVRRTDIGPRGQERTTYWCPTCQPAPG